MRAQNSWAHSHVFLGWVTGGGGVEQGIVPADTFVLHLFIVRFQRGKMYLSSNGKAILKGNPSSKSNFYLHKVYSDEKKENVCYAKIMFWHLKKRSFFAVKIMIKGTMVQRDFLDSVFFLSPFSLSETFSNLARIRWDICNFFWTWM